MNSADATLLGLVADLRAALGDPEGRLMQDELIAHARRLKTEHGTALDVLRQIAANKRRTREQRLASACVGLLDVLANSSNYEHAACATVSDSETVR